MNLPPQRLRWFERRCFGLGVGLAVAAGGAVVVVVPVLAAPEFTGPSDLEVDPFVVEPPGAAPPVVLFPPPPLAGAGVGLGVAVGSGGVVIGVGTSGSGVDNADATSVFNSASAGSFLLRSLYTAASTPINAFLSSGLVLAAGGPGKGVDLAIECLIQVCDHSLASGLSTDFPAAASAW
jgi:hypothetical protein